MNWSFAQSHVLMPYHSIEEAVTIAKLAKAKLVGSWGFDNDEIRQISA